MNATVLPTSRQVLGCFTQEIAAAGGQVLDQFLHGDRLFLRSILTPTWEVRPLDRVQGGVALRTAGQEILVHPYVFRQVCRNGAILAQALQTRRVDRVEETSIGDPEETAREILAEVAAAVRECCAEEIFTDHATQMRSASEQEADLVLQLMPHLAGLPQRVAAQVFADIEKQFSREGDRSLFGLANAITATARDTRDPEMRWRLEEMGGGMFALLEPKIPFREAALALRA